MDGANDPKVPEPAHAYNHNDKNVIDWEIPEGTKAPRRRFGLGPVTTRWALADRFDRVLPPHKRYWGQSRRTLCVAICVILACVIAIVIAVPVALANNHSAPFIPLPNNSQTFTGDLTYYSPALGACGISSGENDAVVAVSHITFDEAQKGHGTNPNNNPLCGKKIRAQRTREDGKQVSIDVTVIDRCTGCQPTDIDVSPAMFDRMAAHDLGRVKTTWAWL